ncbi:uncharacterized protein Z518_01406 [Rhinocladiella mackenziei CBS 650.93]|uniref:Methyltransferase domain-containing protein n=1 Tax=Rhinocladiella mackenziei CBS 650.93 TaxID=1442369 RepID=A0A0D2IWB7_9EURO|nr:uncharacterized protein Z518_01406 [Rhinocladiella mackenziei CBS 650.93]KIX10324.1 hypothetical protein Z518_01406 [Rhinocladiella mackenziei CBS 650.93]
MADSEAAQIALDEDEGLSELDDGETTASVRSSILQNREQPGRRYHAYKDGRYHRPNDEAELERLNIAHALFTMTNENRLHLAPLESDLGRVLDIGTGTGTWAIEFADAYPSALVVGVDDGSLTEEHALRRWLVLCIQAAGKIGRLLRVGVQLGEWVRDAGFTNVQVFKVPVPIGPWPRDKRLKRMGLINWTQIFEGLQAVSLRLSLNVLEWTQPELETLLMEVRRDMKNKDIHALYTVIGQKTESQTAQLTDQ